MNSVLIWLSYGIPSLSLAVFFLYFLGRPEFKYSFYRVLQCDLLINIFCYFNTWISRLCHIDLTIPLMIWFNDNFYFIFHVYSFFDSYFYNAQSMSMIVISTQRLMSSKWTGSNEFWQNNYRKIYGGVIITSGLIAFLNLSIGILRPEYYDVESQLFVKTTLSAVKAALGMNMFLVKSCFVFSALFIINVVTFYLVYKRFSQNLTSTTSKRMMKNLTTVAIVDSILFFVIILWPLGVFNSTNKDFYFYAMLFSDTNHLKSLAGYTTDMLIFWLWLFYGIPSLALVVGFIFFLRRNDFHYSFYRVLQCDLTINIFCYLNTWITRLYHVEHTIPFMVWVNDNFYFVFHFYSFFANYFYNAQSLSVIVMSAHRLWSSKSISGSDFWKNNYGYIYIGVVVLSGLLALLPLMLKPYKPDYYDHEKGAFVQDPVDEKTVLLNNTIFFIKTIIFFTTLLVINIWTIYLVYKRVYRNLANANTRKMMANLTTIALINSFLFFFIIAWPVSVFITLSPEYSYHQVMFTSDMLSLSLPYILMVCDRNVQTSLSKMIEQCFVKLNVRTSGSSVSRRQQNVLSVT